MAKERRSRSVGSGGKEQEQECWWRREGAGAGMLVEEGRSRSRSVGGVENEQEQECWWRREEAGAGVLVE